MDMIILFIQYCMEYDCAELFTNDRTQVGYSSVT